MALILLGKTECSLCGTILTNDDDITGTSHFIGDQNDPLWKYSDSAMHRSCFVKWDRRADFVAKFNRTYGEVTFSNGTYFYMEPDGSISTLKRTS